MQINFKGTNYNLPREVSDYAQKKVEGLKKHMGNQGEFARAYVDLGKETEAHQNGNIWRADINLDVDGERFYAKEVAESIEKAIDATVRELGSELQTARKRKRSLVRKGGSIIKSMLRGA